jgi:uncharacterized protein RhaS with RHS repeats
MGGELAGGEGGDELHLAAGADRHGDTLDHGVYGVGDERERRRVHGGAGNVRVQREGVQRERVFGMADVLADDGGLQLRDVGDEGGWGTAGPGQVPQRRDDDGRRSAAMKRLVRVVACLVLFWTGMAVQARTVHLYYMDPQGTVLAKTDAQGNILARYDYRPYGRVVSGSERAGWARLYGPCSGPGDGVGVHAAFWIK